MDVYEDTRMCGSMEGMCVRVEVNLYILYIVLLSFLFVYSCYGVMHACTVKYIFILG